MLLYTCYLIYNTLNTLITQDITIMNNLNKKRQNYVNINTRTQLITSNSKVSKAISTLVKRDISLSSEAPKMKSVPINRIKIDSDIQRDPIGNHLAKIIENFDIKLMQPINCIKIPGQEEYDAWDGQHTLMAIHLLNSEGLLDIKEVPVSYIETNDRSFARKAFTHINGPGSRPLDQADIHKVRVACARLDNSQDPDDLKANRVQTILEKHNCKIERKEKEGPLVITHAPFAYRYAGYLDIICAWHKRNYPDLPISAIEIIGISKLISQASSQDRVITNEILDDIATAINIECGNITNFSNAMRKSYKLVMGTSWKWDNECIPYILKGLYRRHGGTKQLPTFSRNNRFSDIIKYLKIES